MEISYQGANRKSGYYPLVRETPIHVRFDDKNTLTLDIKKVGIHNMQGQYDVHLTLTPDDIGKIVEAFYKQAITKPK
jgi:hypothetical protein